MKHRHELNESLVRSIERVADVKYGPWKAKMQWFLVSANNPHGLKFFRSELAILQEQLRHLNSGYHYIIHPFSPFRTIYSVYQVIFYMVSIMFGSFEASYIHRQHYTPPLLVFTLLLNLLIYIDIVSNFFKGYVDAGEIVLEPKRIAKRYLKTFFIFDLLGSIPLVIGFSVFDYKLLRAVLSVFIFLRVVRLYTIMQQLEYLRIVFAIRSSKLLAVVSAMVGFIIITHYFICCQLMYYRTLERFGVLEEDWLDRSYWQDSLVSQYAFWFFQVSLYITSMRFPLKVQKMGHAFQVISYLIGKIIMGIIWIVLATFILNFSSPTINYLTKIDQLEEYMRIRQVPKTLQQDLKTFYRYKFRKVGFNERAMRNCISNNLRRQINQQYKMVLMKTIPLLQFVSRRHMCDLALQVSMEIFTPNSIIFQYGDPADYMYFLYSGTVAIYSNTGTELSHMGDGCYFGEIGLITNRRVRSTTVKALEFCEVFKLSRKYFLRLMNSNKRIGHIIKKISKQRIKKLMNLQVGMPSYHMLSVLSV